MSSLSFLCLQICFFLSMSLHLSSIICCLCVSVFFVFAYLCFCLDS
jgi:hypothetical protein